MNLSRACCFIVERAKAARSTVQDFEYIQKGGCSVQASKVNGYITNEGHLVLDTLLSLPPGKVEVIVLSEETSARQKPATKRRSGISGPEKLNKRLAEEGRQLAAMNFDDIGTDEEWTRVQNEALLALEEQCAEEENNGNS